MKEAIIHIGTEKTGSTTIQHFLDINRNALARAGVIFPLRGEMANQLKLAAYCIGEDPDPEQKSLLSLVGASLASGKQDWKNSFREVLEKELAAIPDNSTVVFSSEHLQSRVKRKSEIQSLKKLLDPHFSSFRIVVYLRRQDLLTTSVYNEALKSGSAGRRPLAAHGKIDPLFFDYCHLLDQWSSVFGRDAIGAQLFELERFHGKNLLTDFCHCCNIVDPERYRMPRSKNVALQGDTQHILIRFNQLTRHQNRNNSVYNSLRRYIFKEQGRSSAFPAIRPTRCEAENYLAQFSEGNRRLAAQWFEGKGFSTDTSMYDEVAAEFPDQERVDVMLIEKVEGFCEAEIGKGKKSTLDPADLHRDIAMLMEHLDFERAICHMKEAQKLRPDGPFIQQKLDQYTQ